MSYAEERVSEAWSSNHSYLTNLAFGILGDLGAAEDAVQEAFARLVAADVKGISGRSRLADGGDQSHMFRQGPIGPSPPGIRVRGHDPRDDGQPPLVDPASATPSIASRSTMRFGLPSSLCCSG